MLLVRELFLLPVMHKSIWVGTHYTYSTNKVVLLNPEHYTPFSIFFFFQAEDGIRDSSVTGVQTCALPISEAERLFLHLAHETPDHDLQMRCYNRIHFLREGRRTSYPPGYYTQPRLTPAPGYPNGPSTNPYMTTGRATSQYTYAPIPNNSQATTASSLSSNCQWSGWGWLRRAPFWVDNKQAFVLENNQGMPRLYVPPQPGANQETPLNKPIN